MFPINKVYRAFLIAQLVKNRSAMQETQVQFLGQEDLLEKGQATHSSILGTSLVAQLVKKSTGNAGDLGLTPGLGRLPGEGKATPSVFWPGEFHGLYSPWGCKELDTTEWHLSSFFKNKVYTKITPHRGANSST